MTNLLIQNLKVQKKKIFKPIMILVVLNMELVMYLVLSGECRCGSDLNWLDTRTSLGNKGILTDY